MTSEHVEKTLVEPAAANAVDQPQRNRVLVYCGFTVALFAAAVVLFLLDRDRQVERGDHMEASVSALAQQVRDLGGTPVVAPPGLPGADGVPGVDGRDGRDGSDGRNGVDGKNGTTPPCLSEPPQCRGANGSDGNDGNDGTAGQTGKDGADGAPGQDGAPGEDGADGKPPSGWTWTDSAGRTQTCTRDPGSPDSAPTYTCTAPSDGPPLLRIGG